MVTETVVAVADDQVGIDDQTRLFGNLVIPENTQVPECHCGLDPQSPVFYGAKGLRLKPVMTKQKFSAVALNNTPKGESY